MQQYLSLVVTSEEWDRLGPSKGAKGRWSAIARKLQGRKATENTRRCNARGDGMGRFRANVAVLSFRKTNRNESHISENQTCLRRGAAGRGCELQPVSTSGASVGLSGLCKVDSMGRRRKPKLAAVRATEESAPHEEGAAAPVPRPAPKPAPGVQASWQVEPKYWRQRHRLFHRFHEGPLVCLSCCFQLCALPRSESPPLALPPLRLSSPATRRSSG